MSSTVGRALGALVGLAMALGFGALLWGVVADLRAFPDTPRRVTVAEAVASADIPRGAWVTLTDLRCPRRFGEGRGASGRQRYRLGTGADGQARIVLAGRDLSRCDDGPTTMTGVLGSSRPGRIVGLEFPGQPWSAWPTAHQVTLWTESGPDDSRAGLVFLPWMSALGLVVALFYAWPRAVERVRRGRSLGQLDPGRVAHLRASSDPKGLAILPTRSLSMSPSSWRSVAALVASLGVLGGLLVSLGGWALGDRMGNLRAAGVVGVLVALGLGALVLLGAALWALGLRVVWRAVAHARAFRGPRVEVLVPLEETEGHGEGGVRRVVFYRPHDGGREERVVSVYEVPLGIEGYGLVVYPAGRPEAMVLVQEGFLPFALSPEEIERAEEALAARRGAMGG